MYCPRCHHEIDARNRFCPNCGLDLPQANSKSSIPASSMEDMTGIGWQPSTSNPVQQPPRQSGSQFPPSPNASYRRDDQVSGRDASATNGTIQGIVRNFQQRTETNLSGKPLQLWIFRLDRYDARGNPLPPIPVQMRGRRFEGGLNNGDTVRVKGSWVAGKTLDVKKVYNVTTASEVTTHNSSKMTPVQLGFSIVFVIAVIAIFVLTTHSGFPGIPGLPGGSSPSQTMQDFCQDLRMKSYSEAYGKYSSNLQKSVSYAQFTQNWTGNGSQYYSFDDCSAQDVTTNGNSATTTLNTHEFYSGKTQSYAVTLIEQGSDWKIDTIQAN